MRPYFEGQNYSIRTNLKTYLVDNSLLVMIKFHHNFIFQTVCILILGFQKTLVKFNSEVSRLFLVKSFSLL